MFAEDKSLQCGHVVASAYEHNDQLPNGHEVFSFAVIVLEGLFSNFVDASCQTHSRSLAICLARKVYFQKPFKEAML